MAQWNGVRAHLVAFGGALICANGLEVIMHCMLGRNMSWFAAEHSALLLNGPAALTGSSIHSGFTPTSQMPPRAGPPVCLTTASMMVNLVHHYDIIGTLISHMVGFPF